MKITETQERREWHLPAMLLAVYIVGLFVWAWGAWALLWFAGLVVAGALVIYERGNRMRRRTWLYYRRRGYPDRCADAVMRGSSWDWGWDPARAERMAGLDAVEGDR